MELFDWLAREKDKLFDPNSKLTIFYFLLLFGNIGLVWLLPYFPTQDGPSHIYNLVVLRDLLNGGKDWGNYFSYDLKAVPNLGFFLIAYPLLIFFSPFVVEKLFVSIFIFLLGLSVPFYLRTFGKPGLPLSYFIFPVIFNFTLMMGFYSYVIAIPFMLYGISICWRIRKSPYLIKATILNATGLIIYYIHIIPFCLFLISVFVIPLSSLKNPKIALKNTAYMTATMLPSLYVFLSYVFVGLKIGTEQSHHKYTFVYLLDLIAELPLFSIGAFSQWQIVSCIILFLFYYSVVKITVQNKIKSKIFTKEEKYVLILTGCVLTIYLITPFHFASGGYFNQRLPWVILLMSLPLLQMPKGGLFERFKGQILFGIAAAFLILNTVALYQKSSQVVKFLTGLSYRLPKAVRIMAYKPAGPKWSRIDVLLHAVSYYCIFYKCIDIGNYETSFDYFPVHFKNTDIWLLQESRIAYFPRTIDLTSYHSVDYLVSWKIDNADHKKIKSCYQTVWKEGQLSIWQRAR